MSVAQPIEPTTCPADLTPPLAVRTQRRPLRKRTLHVVRRAHLYFGLFLLPWVVLYGTTGFLFNHPTAFSDAPAVSFGKNELIGTPMESLPKPAASAAQVVTALNERAKEGHPYSLVEPEKARYVRSLATVTVKGDGGETSVAFDLDYPGGTVRTRAAAPPAPVEEKAPFAISANAKGPGRAAGRGGEPSGRGQKGGQRNEKSEPGTPPEAAGPLLLPDPLHERMKATVPVVLERTRFPSGEVSITNVPDLSFLMSDGAKVWRVTYNAMTGTVTGASADSAAPEELSARRFLTRLHQTHGFPGGPNAKWFWAVVVDVMAFVMVFWGISGVFMWWQIKATRGLGLCVLLLSVAAAATLTLGMHEVLSPR